MYIFAQKTSVGKVRSVNEDSLAVVEIPSALQRTGAIGMVVADGMGGYQAGEVASSMATDAFLAALPSLFADGLDEKHLLDFLSDVFDQANKQILLKSAADECCTGMGTTMTAAVCIENRLYVAHAGDSRCYRISPGGIRQMTRDDSLVNELFEAGTITMEEAAVHPQKNIITKALGTEEYLQPQLIQDQLSPGDIVLLTSDGLTNLISDEAILGVFQQEQSLEACVAQLVEMAENAGGFDNISATCCKYAVEDVM